MDTLTEAQFDRALGSILGSAAGDALGSQYEFGDSHPDEWKPSFGVGVFGHDVGEWTDDTAMAMPILEWAAGQGKVPLRHILERWIDWSKTSKDIGAQTRAIIRRLQTNSPDLESQALQESEKLHNFHQRSAGNGSLMRVGPYALASLYEESLELENLRSIVKWTHFDNDNFIACALWSDAIRDSILKGGFDMLKSLEVTGNGANTRWRGMITQALEPKTQPSDFKINNGWVVAAFQGALSSINRTASLDEAIEASIRGGGDTDTVAAITGALAGALYGASALPESWVSIIHGWPGYTVQEIEKLVRDATAVTI